MVTLTEYFGALAVLVESAASASFGGENALLEVYWGVVERGCASAACCRSFACDAMSDGPSVQSFFRKTGVSFVRTRSLTGSLEADSE